VNHSFKDQVDASNESFPNLIMLIDAQNKRRLILAQSLINSGYELVVECKTAEGLLDLVDKNKPDIIVMGIDGPDKLTLDNLVMLNKKHPIPVVVFAEDEAPQVIEQSIKAGVSAYIVNDIQPHRLKSIINVAYVRFIEHQKLTTELARTKNALADRKVLEKAKGLLMRQKNIVEEEAFNLIRKISMNKGLPIAKVAADIIEVLELIELD
jgi:response regulator NasT